MTEHEPNGEGTEPDREPRSDSQGIEYEQYVDFFENAAVPMHWVGPHGTVLHANRAELDALGYAREEYVGHHIAEFHADQDVIEDILARLSADEEIQDYEARMVCKDGSIRHVLIDSSVNWRDGEFVNTRCVTRDVTERKAREAELRESARRLDLALEATETGVWEWNMETDEVIWSETLEELLGIEPGTFDGTFEAFKEYLHPDDAAEVNQAVEQAIEDGTFTSEFRMIRGDGERIWVRGQAEYFSEDGPKRLLGTTTDITDIKERERELQRQNERLAEFASIVSHDLRNPLEVAKGRLQLAKEKRDWSELDAVSGAHDRMQTLIEDMLALATAGEDVGKTETIELSALVENCWRNVEAGSATIDVKTDATFQADETRFKQLLENVFRNAIEHAGSGVEITVGDLSNGFYIEDDGPGIPERERDKVLDPGYSTRAKGSGFGLSIVRDIAHAHGWQITLTEGSEGGARFEFSGIEVV